MTEAKPSCYELNWSDWKCKDMKYCSQVPHCTRKQWISCYKENYGSSQCKECHMLPACMDKKASGQLSSKVATQFLTMALAMSMEVDDRRRIR